MFDSKLSMNRIILDNQQSRWVRALSHQPEMFGSDPSLPAQNAAELFKKEGCATILELGAGQGRDAIYFARLGFKVFALDYAPNGLAAIVQKARKSGLSHLVTAMHHDVRQPLPFEDGHFDACFSHMLFCMELTTKELACLTQEIKRVLKTGGICVYTVRNTGDPGYGKGISRGLDMYENDGFTVHFFDKTKIERLARGFELAGIDEFEEGTLPKKLFQVTLRNK